MPPETHPAVAALRRSHQRLRAVTEPLDAAQLREPSYASEWTVAQVLSHLGSGAQIGGLVLRAAVAGAPSPDQAQFAAIWAVWDAKTPDEQSADAIPADRALVEAYENLDDDQLRDLRVAFGPMELDAAGLVRLRLSEHAVHTWDIGVVLDPAATVDPAAVAELVDSIGMMAGFAGKPAGAPLRVRVSTTEPVREFVLDVGEQVQLGPWDGTAELPRLTLPAEALLRLVYGRLDAGHPRPLQTDGVDLDELRKTFPGF